MTVDILLATYNGERFLRQQLDSLVAQTYTDWRIIARDDGSKDKTVEILETFAAAHPGRMRIIRDGDNLGSCRNFERLMEASDSPHIMFCDQDDIWKPQKVALGMKHLLDMEKRYGKDCPLLVHSDTSVCDESGKQLHASSDKHSHFHRVNTWIGRMLSEEMVTGMTMTLNRALVKKACPMPKELEHHHDSWISKVAALVGHIEYIDKPLVAHRVHDANVTQKKPQPRKTLFEKIDGYRQRGLPQVFADKQEVNFDNTKKVAEVAKEMLKRYGDEVGPRRKQMLEECSTLTEQSPLERTRIRMRYRVYSQRYHRAAENLTLG